jgi:hypothetical protein
MMTVEVAIGRLDITLTGWDRFWALKKELSVPLDHIKNVEVRPNPINPGTGKPSVSAVPTGPEKSPPATTGPGKRTDGPSGISEKGKGGCD